MKLYIAPGNRRTDSINIVTGDGRIICTMLYEDLALAQRIVRRENGWWFTLFGPPRDEKQKTYDEWIAHRNSR